MAQEALREKQEQLDGLLANVGAIVLEGTASEIYYVGGQVEKILGYPQAAWFDHPQGPIGFWSDHIHPDDRGQVESCRTAIVEGRDHSFEYRFMAAGGNEIWFYDIVPDWASC